MGISQPTGPYAQQMISPGGWIQFNEDILWNRAGSYTQVLHKVDDVLGSAKHQQSEIFSGVWSGTAADAANNKLGSNIEQISTLKNDTASVITWHKHVAGLVEQSKSIIYDNVHLSQVQIATWEADPTLDPDARDAAISQLITKTLGVNVGLVGDTADQIRAAKTLKPTPNQVDNLLKQQPAPDMVMGGVSGMAGQAGQTAQTAASNLAENAPSTGELAATAGQVSQLAQNPAVQQGFQQGTQVSQQISQSAQQAGQGGGGAPAAAPAQLAKDSTDARDGDTDEKDKEDIENAKDKALEGAGAIAGPNASSSAAPVQPATAGAGSSGPVTGSPLL